MARFSRPAVSLLQNKSGTKPQYPNVAFHKTAQTYSGLNLGLNIRLLIGSRNSLVCPIKWRVICFLGKTNRTFGLFYVLLKKTFTLIEISVHVLHEIICTYCLVIVPISK